MTISNWAGAGMIALAVLLAVTGAVWFRDIRRTRRADREMHTSFAQDIADVPLQPWNGDTYDWPETGLARYLEAQEGPPPDYTGPLIAWTPATAGQDAVYRPDPYVFNYDHRKTDTQEMPAVPESEVSGPHRVLNVPTDDTDAFIAAMLAETDPVLIRLHAPLDNT
jgi:hypothetical protein